MSALPQPPGGWDRCQPPTGSADRARATSLRRQIELSQCWTASRLVARCSKPALSAQPPLRSRPWTLSRPRPSSRKAPQQTSPPSGVYLVNQDHGDSACASDRAVSPLIVGVNEDAVVLVDEGHQAAREERRPPCRI